jgi:2-aminoadipate transaminase
VSQWLARIVEEFVARGHLDPHVEAVRGVYRRKRDLAVRGLEEHCGDLVTFAVPHGGFFVWVGLADAVDWPAAKAEAARNGVTVREAERFMLTRPVDGPRHFRLGFAHATDAELARGTELLGTALRRSVGEAVAR